MGGLVGYDSSSDEDEFPRTRPPATVSDTTCNDSTHDVTRSQSQHQTENKAMPEKPLPGPVLGPVAPANGDLEEEDSSAAASVGMSERDAVRYLTQAPVPMTYMPPSPPGSPDLAANARFARFLELKAKGVHFNEDLARKSSFLNPGLLSTMMARMGMEEEDQYITSLSLENWNPRAFPEWAYKESLLQSQELIRAREEVEKTTLSAAGRRKIDFTPGGGNSTNSSRKSTPAKQQKRRRP